MIFINTNYGDPANVHKYKYAILKTIEFLQNKVT